MKTRFLVTCIQCKRRFYWKSDDPKPCVCGSERATYRASWRTGLVTLQDTRKRLTP